jgi:hypothetical protein
VLSRPCHSSRSPSNAFSTSASKATSVSSVVCSIRSVPLKQIVAPNWLGFVRKSAFRADSFLVRLSEAEFDHGMAALRAHAAEMNPNDAVTEEIDWWIFTKHP